MNTTTTMQRENSEKEVKFSWE